MENASKQLPPEFLPQLVRLAACDGVIKIVEGDRRVLPMFNRKTGVGLVLVIHRNPDGDLQIYRHYQVTVDGRLDRLSERLALEVETTDADVMEAQRFIEGYLASTEVFQPPRPPG